MDILFGRNQLPVFVSFVICGIISGAFYDILKIKRRIFADRLIFLFVDDLIFCAFCTVLIIFNAYSFNDGNLKWYEVPFMTTGFVLYRKTLSRLFVGFCFAVIDNTKLFVRFLLSPVKKLALRFRLLFTKNAEMIYLQLILYQKRKKASFWRF